MFVLLQRACLVCGVISFHNGGCTRYARHPHCAWCDVSAGPVPSSSRHYWGILQLARGPPTARVSCQSSRTTLCRAGAGSLGRLSASMKTKAESHSNYSGPSGAFALAKPKKTVSFEADQVSSSTPPIEKCVDHRRLQLRGDHRTVCAWHCCRRYPLLEYSAQLKLPQTATPPEGAPCLAFHQQSDGDG